MKQALYTFSLRVEWDSADGTVGLHATRHGLRAPSRKAALDRALKAVMSLPCYADRERAGLRVEAEARLIEVSPSDGHGVSEPHPATR